MVMYINMVYIAVSEKLIMVIYWNATGVYSNTSVKVVVITDMYDNCQTAQDFSRDWYKVIMNETMVMHL